ncbi:MAG: hypothetical protein ACREP9_02600, partial [Candidatus Dormibacteraceae bacterium]
SGQPTGNTASLAQKVGPLEAPAARSGEPPRRIPITERDLTPQERAWIAEIPQANASWADVDVSGTRVWGKCDCGQCRSIYLHSEAPPNPSLLDARGYIGRIEIRTADDFGITITLGHSNGALDELYVNYVDLSEKGDRALQDHWQEVAHTTVGM